VREGRFTDEKIVGILRLVVARQKVGEPESQCMLLQSPLLCLFSKRYVEGGRRQVGVAQGLLHCLEVGAAGDVVGGHRVPETVNGSASAERQLEMATNDN